MKAIVIPYHGGIEVLQQREVPTPAVPPGYALVRVRACGVNHLDLHLRRGLPRVKVPLPHIPGSDVAGVVAEVNGPSAFRPGDPVVVAPGVTCGKCRSCLAGLDHLCRDFGVVGGYVLDGGYAEYVSVPLANLVPFPKGLSSEEAASFATAFQTAWHMIVAGAGVKPGDRVLVHAAGSGVGSAAIQIARLFGAEVVATAGSEKKLAFAKQLGASHVVNYATGSFYEFVRDTFGPQPIDVVVEQVGSAVFGDSLRLLRRGGVLVTCGATADPMVQLDLRYVFARNLKIIGSSLGPKAEFWQIMSLAEQRKLQPVIDRVLPITAAAEAHAIVERREQAGKIVLTIPEEGTW